VFVLFDPLLRPLLRGLRICADRAADALVLGSDGTRTLVVPRLEVEHAVGEVDDRSRRALPRVSGRPPAEDALARALSDAGLTGTIGADQDGYPGSRLPRPTLSELSGATVVRVVEQIERRWR
jgi:hypothetical protein